jgi:hypothetical protein
MATPLPPWLLSARAKGGKAARAASIGVTSFGVLHVPVGANILQPVCARPRLAHQRVIKRDVRMLAPPAHAWNSFVEHVPTPKSFRTNNCHGQGSHSDAFRLRLSISWSSETSLGHPDQGTASAANRRTRPRFSRFFSGNPKHSEDLTSVLRDAKAIRAKSKSSESSLSHVSPEAGCAADSVKAKARLGARHQLESGAICFAA